MLSVRARNELRRAIGRSPPLHYYGLRITLKSGCLNVQFGICIAPYDISAMAGRDRLMVRGGNEKQGAMVFFKKIGLARFESSALCVHALECIGGNHLNTQFSLAECKPVRILLRNRDNNLHGAGLKKSVNVRKIRELGEEWAHPSASQCGFYVYCRRELFRSTAFFLEAGGAVCCTTRHIQTRSGSRRSPWSSHSSSMQSIRTSG